MDATHVIVCPELQRSAALRCLHDGLSSDQQMALVATLNLPHDQPQSDFAGLLVVHEGLELAAACWVQLTPGNAATLWPPDLTHPAAPALLRAARAFLHENGVAFAQLVVASKETVDESLLAEGGFRRLVELAYLKCACASQELCQNGTALIFEAQAIQHPERLEELLLATYPGTLDCPELNDVRTISDVVAGYKNQGIYHPEHWYLVRSGSQDIGVLILAEHVPHDTWELVYMGLIPQVRGRALGEQIVREAVHQVAVAGGSQLVLAVDVRNRPALKMYGRAGFVEWDRRTVYAWIASM